jgi:hypothetical protein
MSPNYEEYRLLETAGQWQFQVDVIVWPHPHEPETSWVTFRTWKRPPTEARIALAKAAALRNPRFFSTCKHCGELNNAGHMADHSTCYGCAERYFGVVH